MGGKAQRNSDTIGDEKDGDTERINNMFVIMIDKKDLFDKKSSVNAKSDLTPKRSVSFIEKPEDQSAERALFGGAIASTFPLRFQDISNVREVPDNREVFVDPMRDESLIFELLELKVGVADNASATWFLQDLAREQDAEGNVVIEQSGVFQAEGLHFRNMPAVVTTAAISKGRQGREAQNLVRVYLANLRLKEVDTDVVIVANEPIYINPLSESASAVGAGLAVPAAQSGCMAMADVFTKCSL
ncbi:hypothetical protein RJ639_044925 [Escallonia herrerae]|uniref:Ran guanine nucleotide release factor n=1 Tax=Escallonia herrerae TaxID=1293975 RepID=A0AA88WP62_9ASTE|nr:hypothetical protein RJ639_044925 [Escallonia herrerae]